MTLTDSVNSGGSMRPGDHRADDVKALQAALHAAGYRVDVDGDFGPGTERAVLSFQKQHGLVVDGRVGPKTARLLGTALPDGHAQLVASATPLVQHDAFNNATPHDDTASLVAFYGDPRDGLERWKADHVVSVQCPWTLYYDGKPWPHPVEFHRKAATLFKQAFDSIWDAANRDDSSPLLTHVRVFDGSGDFRPVRGSSRLSCHAFWAAIDFDAERLPLGHGVPKAEMPEQVVNSFVAAGIFWGGNYAGRKDPMHFQAAYE